jgi:hypothetical protein
VRGRDLAATPSLIVLMSLQLAIPGGLLSSRARFRFTNRRLLCNNTAANCKEAIAGMLDPTLTCGLTLGAHPTLHSSTHPAWVEVRLASYCAPQLTLLHPPCVGGSTTAWLTEPNARLMLLYSLSAWGNAAWVLHSRSVVLPPTQGGWKA